ncbi:hypothetical protein ElyMa_006281900 [Elysia marginata]|uniref:Uncharacterized protein n=1 Tax=Elysia marginata TaxID=1093978 RepID=A0AAV4HDZ0_9GAST|nr:hypothetical protein ElyMa_006281900 [Elysia marginata]
MTLTDDVSIIQGQAVQIDAGPGSWSCRSPIWHDVLSDSEEFLVWPNIQIAASTHQAQRWKSLDREHSGHLLWPRLLQKMDTPDFYRSGPCKDVKHPEGKVPNPERHAAYHGASLTLGTLYIPHR